MSMLRSWLRSWLGVDGLSEDIATLDRNEQIARAHLLQEVNKAIAEAREHGNEQTLALARRIGAHEGRLSSIEGTERVKKLKLAEDGPSLPGFS